MKTEQQDDYKVTSAAGDLANAPVNEPWTLPANTPDQDAALKRTRDLFENYGVKLHWFHPNLLRAIAREPIDVKTKLAQNYKTVVVGSFEGKDIRTIIKELKRPAERPPESIEYLCWHKGCDGDPPEPPFECEADLNEHIRVVHHKRAIIIIKCDDLDCHLRGIPQPYKDRRKDWVQSIEKQETTEKEQTIKTEQSTETDQMSLPIRLKRPD